MSKIEFKQGPRSKFKDFEFWAEGGMVCIESQSTGDFKVLPRAEAAARAIALNEELKYIVYPDERDELSRCVQNLCEAVKEARRQGDPSDPEVRRDRIKSARKVSMLKSGESKPSSPPEVPFMSSFTQIPSSTKSDRFTNLSL